MRVVIIVVTVAIFGLTLACSRSSTPPAAAPVKAQTAPGPLAANGFKAQITIVEPPAKLRSSQKETIHVRIKNASEIMWWARGAEINASSSNKFYIATGNRWLKSDGSVLTDMDGRSGIGKDLKPGEETEVSLVITAPKDPGEYTLEVDVLQEQVAWFSDKGSTTAKTKISVVK